MCLGLMMGNMVVSATKVVDVDNQSLVLAGETILLEGTKIGTFPDTKISAKKYASITERDTDSTVVIVENPPRTDFYFKWSSSKFMPSVSHRYAEIHYTVNDTGKGGFTGIGSSNRFRVQTSNEPEAWDDFSNPELIDGSIGSHSMIIDLQADKKYSGKWTALRWDFFNEVSNGGKSITIDKIVFGTETKTRPGPLGLITG